MSEPITKGIDIKSLGLGVVVLAFGVGLGAAGMFGDFTLAIGNFALPQWSIYALAGVAVLVGIVLALTSLSSEKCASCGEHLDYGEAYFPLEREAEVMQAVQSMDGSGLASLEKVPKNQMKMAIEMGYCPGCGQAGKLAVTKWQDYQPHDVVPEQVVGGPAAAPFSQVVAEHVSWRGEDDD